MANFILDLRFEKVERGMHTIRYQVPCASVPGTFVHTYMLHIQLKIKNSSTLLTTS